MLSSSINLSHRVLCLFVLLTVLIADFQLLFLNTFQKLINGVG